MWFGRFSLAFFITVLAIVLIPAALASNIPVVGDLQKNFRGQLLKFWYLSFQGPFAKMAVWCGKKSAGRLLSSACQAPNKLAAKATGTTVLQCSWTPNLPMNPFHEEEYVCSWRSVGDTTNAGSWHQKDLTDEDYQVIDPKDERDTAAQAKAKEIKKDAYGRRRRYKVVIQGLPVFEPLEIRVAAVSKKGRGPWSTTTVTTLAEPNNEGGFVGLLGGKRSADGKLAQYKWWQSKHEVGCKVPLADSVKPKEIRVLVTRQGVKVTNATTDTVIFSGDLFGQAKVDEVFWEVEVAEKDKDVGRHLALTLRKEKLMEKWASFLTGKDHPLIDVQLLRLHYEGNAMTEMASHDLWE